MPTTVERPKPFLLPQFCKGCGRCIEACPQQAIEISGIEGSFVERAIARIVPSVDVT